MRSERYFHLEFLIFLLLPVTAFCAEPPTEGRYDEQAFATMMHAKNKGEMLALLKKYGLDVFGTRPSQGLPLPPAPVLKIWNERTTENAKAGQMLSGEFFRDDDLFGGYKHGKPFVIITPDVSESVLAHEFLHFLYQQERKKRPTYEAHSILDAKKKAAADAFGTAVTNRDRDDASFKKTADTLIDVSFDALTQSSIEEAWIAYHLAKATKTGQWNMPEAERREHCQHGLANLQLSRRPFLAFQHLIEKLKQIGSSASLQTTAAKLDTVLGQISGLEEQLKTVCPLQKM